MNLSKVYTINNIKELKGISGIYKLAFNSSTKFYIGSSNNLFNRLDAHYRKLKKGNHENSALNNAVNKHSLTSLYFTVMETCPIDILIEREQYYINTLHPNYNIAKWATGGAASTLTEDDVLNIRKQYFSRTCNKDFEDLAAYYGLTFDYLRNIANQTALKYIPNTEELQTLIDSNKGKKVTPSPIRKLNREQVGMIRWAIANNKSTAILTKEFGVDDSAIVRRIRDNKIYREYTDIISASHYNLPDKQISKLTDYQIAQVKWAHSKNIPHGKISKYFGCHYNTSCDIKMGRVYSNITELIPCEELLN